MSTLVFLWLLPLGCAAVAANGVNEGRTVEYIKLKPGEKRVINTDLVFEFGETTVTYNVSTQPGYVLTAVIDKLMTCEKDKYIKFEDQSGLNMGEYCNKTKLIAYRPVVTGERMVITVYMGASKIEDYQLTVYSDVEPRGPPPLPLKPQSKCKCGVPAINKETGCGKALEGEIPWQVLIKARYGGRVHTFCGGSLISREFVLTTAHCLTDTPLIDLVVVMGTVDRFDLRQLSGIKSAEIHEDYDDHTKEHDIALVKLEFPVQYTDNIMAVCLPMRISNKPLTGEEMQISGWGLHDEEDKSKILQKGSVLGMSYLSCFEKYEMAIYNQMCADKETGDVCKGDEGGPLTMVDSGVHYLMGITSLPTCGSPMWPSVYTRVTGYLRWIYDKAERKLCFK